MGVLRGYVYESISPYMPIVALVFDETDNVIGTRVVETAEEGAKFIADAVAACNRTEEARTVPLARHVPTVRNLPVDRALNPTHRANPQRAGGMHEIDNRIVSGHSVLGKRSECDASLADANQR
ncbi:hypothetical protein GCM10007874_32760 [Labrys miyagiensis]|uniref:Uncharacterized protein n=1 Tax=Labrys miyagiensis TaxID=346912 RepID=A0ABQ6CJ59_9HYPH|nr:hypothetical protein [Labrys miyagiensis]GLS20259.1 hypothetical protein GCM10007874_32760 [Labrys miyagiensis]